MTSLDGESPSDSAGWPGHGGHGSTATTSTDPEELLRWATRIAARYMGEAEAEADGRRNAVPPEMVVRVTPTKVTAVVGVAE